MSKILKDVQIASSGWAVSPGRNSRYIRREAAALLHEAREEADELLAKARQEATELLEKTSHQVTQIEREAEQRGLERGTEIGRKQIWEEGQAFLSDLQSLVNLTGQEAQQLLERTEPQILKLAIEIADKILRREVSLDKDVVLNLAKEALKRASDKQHLVIRVNLEDLEHVQSSKEELISMVDGIKGLEVVDDRRVAPGGCIVESKSGAVDARLETQLERIGMDLEELATHE